MNISKFLTLERTYCNAKAVSKKRVLEFIADFIAEQFDFVDADPLYHHLLDRERLGSTGIGEGVAVPHCRLPSCAEITGALIKLETPVDFDAIDNAPVDLIFALVVPDEQDDEHLKTLATIAELLQSEDVRNNLRNCSTSNELYQQAVASH